MKRLSEKEKSMRETLESQIADLKAIEPDSRIPEVETADPENSNSLDAEYTTLKEELRRVVEVCGSD